MKTKHFFLFIFLFLMYSAFSQSLNTPDKYYVQFTDKNNSPYSLDNPQEYLSQRAIERRQRQGIAIDMKDIPVNPQYIQGVKDAGAEILFPTKWFNGVTVIATNQSVINAINALSYVSDVKLITYTSKEKHKNLGKKTFFENETYNIEKSGENFKGNNGTGEFNYGNAYQQINLINGIPLHEAGYRGEGMVIAVLDAGFENVQTQPLFDSLRINGQILGTKDFIVPGGNVYQGHSHGRMVLSCMGANKPGVMIGTAPKASYWLLRPENPVQEYIAEEYNWVSAAEFADSVGADVINSSLGYVDFDDASQDHTFSELDGNTAVVTIGADVAVSRGMIVCNSAGNNGGDWWNHLGFPADGDSVFTVGAVDNNGDYAYFSSPGPTYDGRIKPNTVATGSGATVADTYSGTTYASGTSFSSPITAGMVACLWQAHPYMKNMDVIWSIMKSGSVSDNPNNQIGWGIPDYESALNILTSVDNIYTNGNELIKNFYPNPFSGDLHINFNEFITEPVKIEITDITGKIVFSKSFFNPGWNINIRDNSFVQGIYIINVYTSRKQQTFKVVKN